MGEEHVCSHPFCAKANRPGREEINGKWWCWVCAGNIRMMETPHTGGIRDARQFYNRPSGPEGDVSK